MATLVNAEIEQSKNEIRSWTVDFTDDLPTGGTIKAGTATHTPPSGAAATPTVTFTDTTVTATLGTLTVTGVHYLDIQGTDSSDNVSELRIVIPVNYPPTAARESMADLITILRGMTWANPFDYQVAGVPYWSDAQLQTVLDRHASTIRHAELRPLPTVGAGGSISYFDYQSPRRFFESTIAGTSRFIIQDNTGATVGTAAYTVDYPRGLVTFGTTTIGLSRYVTGYSYDLNAAAADIWTQKAAHYASAYDFSTDNHSLSRSQLIKNALTMAKEYGSGGAVYTVSVDRSDTDDC